MLTKRRYSGFAAWFVAVALCASSLASAQQAASITDRLLRANMNSSLEEAALRPWHMKVSVQLFDDKGKPAEQGTIEQWWSGPGLFRVTYHFPSYSVTRLENGDGLFRTPESIAPPYLIEEVRHQIIHPMPFDNEIKAATPDLRKETFGKTDLDCIMLTQPLKGVAYPPLGLFPTYCLSRGKDEVRISFDFGSQTAVRSRVGSFQQREVAVDLAINSGTLSEATAHLEELTSQAEPYAETADTTQLIPVRPATARISGALMAGSILNQPRPRYPEGAKQRHVSGAVVMRAVIGADGHVHSLSPVSVPDADLTMAALAAARQWTYKPYLLNGEPIDVETTITVNFHLGP